MPDAPTPIPARLAYRLCADIITAQVVRLRSRTPGASGRRRGVGAAASAADKLAGRQAHAEQMARESDAMTLLARQEQVTSPGVDAACLGYLLAWLSGHGEALKELRAELADCDRVGVLDGIPTTDRLRIARTVIG